MKRFTCACCSVTSDDETQFRSVFVEDHNWPGMCDDPEKWCRDCFEREGISEEESINGNLKGVVFEKRILEREVK